ncbi:MAG: GtrA family protein [Clostridia bacterium]|nr:GtrA family protein [Clostridia bacterium]
MLNFLSSTENSVIDTLVDWALDNIGLLAIIAGIGIAVCAVIYLCFYKKINALIKKYREIIVYVIVGGITTVINMVIHIGLVELTKLHELVIVFIAWFFAVIFAYIVNKLWVFQSKSFKKDVLVHEIISFTGARVFSLGVEELIFLTFVTWLNMNQYVIKAVAAIIIIIINYVFSKLVIFKKNDKK